MVLVRLEIESKRVSMSLTPPKASPTTVSKSDTMSVIAEIHITEDKLAALISVTLDLQQEKF